MQKTLYLAAALAVFGMINARSSPGACGTPQLQPAFDATRYTGLWFNVARDKNSPFENGNCEQTRYSINADRTLRVINSQFDNATQTFTTVDGNAVCDGPQCAVTFFSFSPPGDYRVMATDYENFALVYACRNVSSAKVDFAWVLTRERHPKQEFIDKALATLNERVPEFTTDNLAWTYQGGACQYLKDAPVQ